MMQVKCRQIKKQLEEKGALNPAQQLTYDMATKSQRRLSRKSPAGHRLVQFREIRSELMEKVKEILLTGGKAALDSAVELAAAWCSWPPAWAVPPPPSWAKRPAPW